MTDDHQPPGHRNGSGTAPGGEAAPQPPGARPLAERLRHWHHWRTGGILVALAGVIMLIAGHFSATGRAMAIGGFFILSGAVIFTVGVIGGWITREKPLD